VLRPSNDPPADACGGTIDHRSLHDGSILRALQRRGRGGTISYIAPAAGIVDAASRRDGSSNPQKFTGLFSTLRHHDWRCALRVDNLRRLFAGKKTMREPLGAEVANKRLCELVGRRVEVVTLDGRWFGWLRTAPLAHDVATSRDASAPAGAFTLWGARDDIPDQEVPFRVFSLDAVLGIREMT
jgi:hypothetical protein